MLNQAQKVLADSFLQSFESLIDDRILKVKNIDANYEQKLIKLVVNSKLSATSFTTIQQQFKELLIKDLSIEPTIIWNNDVCISLNDLYNLSSYNISKRSGLRFMQSLSWNNRFREYTCSMFINNVKCRYQSRIRCFRIFQFLL